MGVKPHVGKSNDFSFMIPSPVSIIYIYVFLQSIIHLQSDPLDTSNKVDNEMP